MLLLLRKGSSSIFSLLEREKKTVFHKLHMSCISILMFCRQSKASLVACSPNLRHFFVPKQIAQQSCTAPVQFSSVTQSCLTLFNPMDCSMIGLPVHHQFLEFTQIHVHWVGDTIQPSHPLLSPYPPAFNLFQKKRYFPMSQFFTSGGQSIRVSASESVLPMNIQDLFPLGWTGWISLLSKGFSRVFSNTTVRNHQFFSAQLSL